MNEHATEAVIRAAGGAVMILVGAVLVLSAPVVLVRRLYASLPRRGPHS